MRNLGKVLAAVAITLLMAWSAHAQVSSPASINGTYPTGTNSLGGTADVAPPGNGNLTNLGANQGVDFDFRGVISGAAGRWNSGFSFLTADILQVQADNTGLPSNYVDYTFDFSGDVYGLQFTMGGLDNADETIVTFYHHGVQVAIDVSTYVNGAVAVSDPNDVITFAGTNIDITPFGDGFRADGDGNNDVGGLGIHGAQEEFSVSLPIDVVVDEVRFFSTGKNDGSGGNVTLIYKDFAWAAPDIALVKSSSFSQGGNSQSNPGDLITYNYTVTNNGGVALTNVELVETTFTGTGTTPVPGFLSGTGGGTAANLPAGETLTYSVTYPVTDEDLVTGFIDNQATVTALPDGGLLGTDEISDLSDSANVGDGGSVGSLTEDDTTRTTPPAPIVFNPLIEAVKTANTSGFSSPARPGETISYNITVSNEGDVRLDSVNLTDTLANGDGDPLGPIAPVFQSSSAGSAEGTLIVGESATYTVSYNLTQIDIDSGLLENSVLATATPISGGTVNDISDDDDDGDGNIVDDATITSLSAPALMIVKSASPELPTEAGAIISYTYRVTNTGNQTLSAVSIAESHNASGPVPTPTNETIALVDDVAPTGDSTDVDGTNGIWTTLAPGDTIEFEGEYIVTQNDVDTLQ